MSMIFVKRLLKRVLSAAIIFGVVCFNDISCMKRKREGTDNCDRDGKKRKISYKKNYHDIFYNLGIAYPQAEDDLKWDICFLLANLNEKEPQQEDLRYLNYYGDGNYFHDTLLSFFNSNVVGRIIPWCEDKFDCRSNELIGLEGGFVYSSKKCGFSIRDYAGGNFLLNKPDGHDDYVAHLIDLDNQRFATASGDNSIKIWNAETGECLNTLEGHDDGVLLLADLGNEMIASTCFDNYIKIWNVNTGECLRTFKGHDGWADSLITLDNNRIATCSGKEIEIRNMETEKYLSLDNHEEMVNCLAYLGDEQIASGSKDWKIRILSTSTGRCLKVLEGHEGEVVCIIDLGSNRIASGSKDGKIKIWDTQTGKCLITLEGHEGTVEYLDNLGDGRIVSASKDNTIRVWNLNKHYDYELMDILSYLKNGSHFSWREAGIL